MKRYELIIESLYGVAEVFVVTAVSLAAAERYAREKADGFPYELKPLN